MCRVECFTRIGGDESIAGSNESGNNCRTGRSNCAVGSVAVECEVERLITRGLSTRHDEAREVCTVVCISVVLGDRPDIGIGLRCNDCCARVGAAVCIKADVDVVIICGRGQAVCIITRENFTAAIGECLQIGLILVGVDEEGALIGHCGDVIAGVGSAVGKLIAVVPKSGAADLSPSCRGSFIIEEFFNAGTVNI